MLQKESHRAGKGKSTQPLPSLPPRMFQDAMTPSGVHTHTHKHEEETSVHLGDIFIIQLFTNTYYSQGY